MSLIGEEKPGTAKTKRVEVMPYDPAWPLRFEEVRTHLLSILSGRDVRVEHVGSTSVPDLAAKPILDIDLVLQNAADFAEVKSLLEANGYHHVGDLGIVGREAFKYDNKPQFMSHHLYVLSEDSDELKRHLTFRDWLRSHPEDRDAYAQAKMAAALRFPNNIDAYIDAKSNVIFDIYTRCGLFSAHDLHASARSVLNNRYDLRVEEIACKPMHTGVSLCQAQTAKGMFYLLAWEIADSSSGEISLPPNAAESIKAYPLSTASGQTLCSTPFTAFALFASEQDARTFLTSNGWQNDASL